MEYQKQKFQWAEIHFKRFIEDIKRTHLLAKMSIEGITMLHQIPGAFEEIMQQRGVKLEGTDAGKGFEELKKGSELAKREVDEKFPLIHAQFTVAIWTLLEEMIRSFIASLIRSEPYAMQKDCIRELKVNLGEYEGREGDDKFLYIVELLEQKYGAGIKYGVDRFEALLKLFDLSGEIPEKMKRTIFEWAQIRNCIVHRAGTVDSQLLKACAWLPFKVDEKLIVSEQMSRSYHRACGGYVLILLERMMIKTGDKAIINSSADKYAKLREEWA